MAGIGLKVGYNCTVVEKGEKVADGLSWMVFFCCSIAVLWRYRFIIEFLSWRVGDGRMGLIIGTCYEIFGCWVWIRGVSIG